ncbi:MAG: hypothetical protein L3J79_07995, partial [Candidatus Marinimicrobia bacterium]|nr:hypothetical protein [Candidatus Neomarinimicrobiota bacterium]
RQHHQHLFHTRKPSMINDYAAWLQREWNHVHPKKTIQNLTIYYMMRDNRYPEDGISQVTMYPIDKIHEHGWSIFLGDSRRNKEDAERAKEREELKKAQSTENQ